MSFHYKNTVLVIPFSWDIPKEFNGFVSPQTMRFTLTPFMSAKRFNCNLRAGDEYLFHFRVDFRNANEKYSKDAVIRNSTKKMKWLNEERDISSFPFSKGITCDILFHAYGSTVTVSSCRLFLLSKKVFLLVVLVLAI
ncbi:galactoside-binding lectin [Oesophagostomum dentatum]|uniref:Galectin n=1 Tax=Oesophagostomum dentatum TaxID=61180 RepID=A0A0B1S2N5_OESDE|nr:galactoside-binding lectin [Oesophagostomum dentatum]